jgi:hypothetical protein
MTADLATLRRERDPDLDAMRRERDPRADDAHFYGALGRGMVLPTLARALAEWERAK